MRSEGFLRRRAGGSGYGKKRKRGSAAETSRNRALQIEQCESRLLLTISPAALQLVSISPYETSILGTTPPSNSLIYGPGVSNTVRTVAPTELVLDFNQGQNIDPATLGAIQVFRSGGDNQFQTTYNSTTNTYATNANNTVMDVPVPIGSATINQVLNTTTNQLSSNEVVIRFSQDLPADLYEVVIAGKAKSPLDDRLAAQQIPLGAVLSPATASAATDKPFDGGQDQVIDFTLETGAHVTSVVPQPISRSGAAANSPLVQARNEIDVYFDQQMNAASAQDPSLYQLIVTNNTADTTDQTIVQPSQYTVSYTWNPATGISESRIIVTKDAKGNPITDLTALDPNLASEGMPSAFRLRIGNQYFPFSTDTKTAIRSPDETFVGADANNLGTVQNATTPLGGETWVINGNIEPQTYALEWPGGTDTPGNRDLPVQPLVQYDSHFGPFGVADASSAIPTFYYNFADKYDSADLTQHNEITDAQKQLVRDVFQLYANYLGVKFEETYSPTEVPGEMTIATGDLAAVGAVSGAGEDTGAVPTAEGAGLDVMDGAVDWGTNAFGGAYFTAAMRGISYLLGYAYGVETPQESVLSNISDDPTVNLATQPAPENILPSPIDIATGQYMYRTDSSAIDLYKFELPTAGTLSLETIAQRMQNSSTLNTNLELFNSQDQVIARNDDYYGTDSYINLVNLPAGTYYVGVSASGNDNYNPNVPLSGTGGTSQGPYELRIGFAPSPAAPATVLVDGNLALDSSANVPDQPAAVLADGNIALDNQSGVTLSFTAGTAPLTAGLDNGHPVINTTKLTTASLATLNGQTFQITKGGLTYPFQFVDSSNASDQVSPGDISVLFNSTTDTGSSVAQDIANRLNSALWVTFTAGTAPLTAGTDGGRPAIGAAGLTTASIATLDGKTFNITKGTNTYTFEFVDSSIPARQAAAGHLELSFNSQTDTVSSILQYIAGAIDNAVSNLIDTTATPLDGDDDGIPGGQYNDWFNVQDTAHTLYVDKMATAASADGSLAHPFTTVQAALSAAPGPATLQADGNITIDTSTVKFTFAPGTTAFVSGIDGGHPAITGITAANIPSMAALNHKLFTVTRNNTGVTTTFEFVDVTVAGNTAAAGHQAVYYDSASDTPTSLQSIIAKAMNGALQPGQIVRIVGNNSANDNSGNTIVAVAANTNASTPLIQNGQTFTVSDGTQSWVPITPVNGATTYAWVPNVTTFEFTRTGTVTAGHVAVLIKPTDTPQQVAQDIANAINSVNVNASKLANGLHVTAAVVQDPTTLQWEVSVTGPSVNVNLGAQIKNDPLISSLQDNVAYDIGTDPLGNVLSDGATMSVPKGTTLMIDAGAVFKLMNANIDVGSSAVAIDRSLGAIQVLGTPSEDVYFTSWNDQRVGSAFYANSQGPAAGDWGGLVFRNDFDYQEQVADPTRMILEQQGIFLDYVNHANIAYGGGQVTVNGVKDYFDPIYLVQARPSIGYNTITFSEHAAVSADPNSFQETLFHDSFGESPFTADYERAGPSIYGNLFTNDTYNGVFIRVTTAAGSSQEQLTTDARLTSTDAVYVLAETLSIAGNPGGGVDDIYSPGSPAGLGDSATTSLTSAGDGLLSVPATITDLESFILSDTYTSIRFEFDYFASHGASSGSVEIPIDPSYSAAQIATAIANAINSSGLRIKATEMTVIDAQGNNAAYVSLSGATVVIKGLSEVEARLGGRLDIDPGVIVKASAARIETEVGGEFLAEGTIDRPIIFTSLLDQAYGAGGTFDTANQNITASPRVAAAGDWSGLYFAPTAFGSMDYTRNYYGGGTSAIEGGFAYFAPIEIRQAQVRITNSIFENNTATADPGNDRNGRGDLPVATVIQIRGAQPIMVNDVILNNPGADAISIDVNSLDSFQNQDWGRSTGPADVFSQYASNVGPMFDQIKMSNNALNGLLVRAGTLLTEGVWDDADIVHVVEGTIVVPNVTIYGGLKLESSSQESLVVKLLGPNAELLASGTPEDIQGRIGGSIQIIGTPAHPVVLTSLNDNTMGAGFDPWGNPQFETGNNPAAVPKPGDWNSVILDSYSNDYNVAEINEYEPAYGSGSTDLDGSIQTAQSLGQLASSPDAGDDTLRLGFEVQGAINYDNPADKDVYSFQATAGTQVWLDIDRSTYALDSQIDLLDANGDVLATAYASIDPATGNEIAPQFAATGQFAATMDPNPVTVNGITSSTTDPWFVNNMYSTNPNDAGMRVILPGPEGQQRTYYVRVSSHSGKSSGNYELQIRLQSTRVTPGNVVRYATIDYATNGVEVLGKPDHSPLEVQSYNYVAEPTPTPDPPLANTVDQNFNPNNVQSAGNLLASDENDLNVAGYLQDYTDVNWFSFSVDYTNQSGNSTIENAGITEFPVIFDIGYNSGLARTDAVLWIFDSTGKLILHGTGSQIADQQVEPLQGANSGNLTHASYSIGDGYIGPVYLPTGSTYYVAITTLAASSRQATDPELRWEPVDSINQIADDNIGSQNATKMPTAPPFVLFPGTTAAQVDQAAVPFNLGDVPLYVLTTTDLFTADAYTGTPETQVDDPNLGLPYTNPKAYQNGTDPFVSYGDLVMRNDGRLYAITQAPGSGAPPAPNGVDQNLWSGTFVQLDTGNASNAPISTQADGINTYRVIAGPALDLAGDDNHETGGVAINAATFGPGNQDQTRNLYVVGNAMQDPTGIPSAVGVGGANYHLQNLLYVESDNGVASDPKGVINDDSARLPTQIIPLGNLQTGDTITPAQATLQGANILDGTQFTITDNSTPANTVTFEMDSGPDLDLGKFGAQGVRNGQAFVLTDKTGKSTAFEFVSGPVLIFPNDVGGNLNQATFTITDDTGMAHSFEFIEATTPPTTVAAGFTGITIAANNSALQVARAAIASINANAADTKAALGEYGDAALPVQDVNPKAGSTWARVSLILDSTIVPPATGNQGPGSPNLIQIEGSYTPTPLLINNVSVVPTAIYYKETYNDPTFLAIEQAVPTAPVNPTAALEGFPWPADFGGQIQATVQAAMPSITVGESPAAVPGVVGGDTDMRINFYGAVNTGFTNTGAPYANFGQASALVHDATTANADFNIRSVDVGAKYNSVVVKIVTGAALNVAFAAGAGGNGGTLTITVTAATTSLQVVTAINAAAKAAAAVAASTSPATPSTMPFTASLDGSQEIGGTNNGSGIVKANAAAATTAGGFDHGIMTWTDTTATPQVEDQFSPWNSVWTWNQGVDHLGDPGGLYGPLSGTGTQYQSSTNFPVPFGVGDSAITIAQEMTAAINAARRAGLFTVIAVQYGPEVDLTNGSNTILPTAESPLNRGGAGPGGNVTGMAYESIDGVDYYFAVSDNGGVYEIANINSPEYGPLNANPPTIPLNDIALTGGGPKMIYLGAITDAAGQNVEFEGLTAGPPDVDNGAYSRMLFGIGKDGTLYALAPEYLDTATPTVALDPIFLDDATSIATGLANVTGLAFTTLDYNLWHVTDARGSGTAAADVGHGVNPDYDGARPDIPADLTPNGLSVAGGESFYFGLEDPTAGTTIAAQPGALNYLYTNPGLYDTYNLPDGAAGSLQTQPVDLSNYSAGDQPMLYFNYFLAKGGPKGYDTAKVYASADGSTWTELPGEATTGLADSGGNWLQAEYSLAAFAGDANVQVRFDFSTAGTQDLGDASLTGSYLTALSGAQLDDGDTFTLTDLNGVTNTFVFDMGEALTVPNAAGDVLHNGETFTIQTGTGANQTPLQTFEFTTQAVAAGAKLTDGNLAIPFVLGETTAQVVQEIVNVVNGAALFNSTGQPIVANDAGNRAMLSGAEGVTKSANSTLTLVGNGSGSYALTGEFPVPVKYTDSASTVATEIADAIAGAFGRQIELRAVAGSAIPDQSTFTVTDQNGLITTFEFTHTNTAIPGDVVINYKTTDTAAQVATEIANAITGLTYTASAMVARTTSKDGFVVLTGTGLVFNGGTSPITQAASSAANVSGSLIYTEGFTVDDPGVLPFSATLPGDTPTNRFLKNARGQDNNHEGWYVDDVQIGFAGRGEMATTPGSDNNALTTNQDFLFPNPGPIENGYYTLQIRRAADYGTVTTVFAPPALLTINRSFDVNDRLSDDLSMTTPDANNISNGETFTVSDGITPVTFQYLGQGVNSTGTNPNDQPIYFTSDETPAQIATATAAAINLANTRGLTTVEATAGGVEKSGLQLAAVAGADILDGSTFSLTDYVTGTTTTFTFSATGAANGTADVITYSATDSATQVADEVAAAINAAHLTYTASYLGPIVSVRGTILVFTPGSSPLTDLGFTGLQLQAPGAESITNHSTFSIMDWTGAVTTYEFLSAGAVSGNNVAIRFLPGASAAQIAADIALALSRSRSTISVQGDLVFVEGAGLSFQEETSAVTNITPENVVDQAGLYLFQAANVTTSWAAPIVPASTLPARNPSTVDYTFQGDVWNVMDQGQDMIEENSILNSLDYGVYVAGVEPTQLGNANQPAPLGTDPSSHPYSVNVMRAVDANRLVPGITIVNNLLAYGGTGGILFSGNPTNGTATQAAAPFGHIVNNTIYGGATPTGTGILVQNNASPTILNNIVASLNTGIDVVAPAGDVSNSTVVGYSVYQNDTTDNNLAANADTDAIFASSSTQLFVNAAKGNFYPSQFSPVIDSSVNQLDDRPSMVSVRQPLAIPSSPILAPNYDLYGQLRIADTQVSPYPGLGSNVYKDRGAIDRVEIVGPTSALVAPQDNDAAGLDIDPRLTWVTTTQQQTQFAVQINDSGAGVDNSTVISANVVLTQDPDNNPADIKTLVQGTDYFFNYDATNHIIHLIPAAGVWAEGSTYNILLTTGILNLAGNPIQPNRLDNTNQFTIVLAGLNGSNIVPAAGIDFSHAPGEPVAWQVEPTAPTLYLGKIPPITQAAYVASQTRSDNDSINTSSFTLAQGQQVTIPVTVTDTGTAPAYLNVWIDLFADGDFTDAGDQVITNQVVTNGVNNITFTVPTGLNPANPTAAIGTWLRLRVSTQQGLASTGGMPSGDTVAPATAEPDGEVEDFAVSILPPVTVTGTVWNDLNASGVYNTNDTGLGGWTIYDDINHLGFYVSGDPSTTTAANGAYTLGDIPPGPQLIGEVPQANWYESSPSSLPPTNGFLTVNGTNGQTLANENFLNYATMTITGTVWNDLNDSGAFVTGDPGLAGWTVYVDLTKAGHFVTGDPSATTTANGTYTISNALAGTDSLGEVVQANWVETSPSAAGPTKGFLTVTGTQGQTISANNFLDNFTTPPSLVNSPAGTGIAPIGVNLVAGKYLTNATSVQYVVSFNEGVTGADAQTGGAFTEFSLVTSGLTGASITSVVPTAGDSFVYQGTTYTTAYTVTISTGSGSGTLQLNLADKGKIKDPAGRLLTGTGSGGTTYDGLAVTIDKTAPTLPAASFIVTSANPTNGTTATYQLTFSEAVTGVTLSDLALATGSLAGSTVAGVTSNAAGTVYTVTVNLGGTTGSSGTVQLVVNDTASPITDLAGNLLAGTPISGPTITIDRVQPKPTITVPASELPATATSPINFTVVFSASVTGFTAAGVSFSGSTAPGKLVAVVTGSGTTYNIAVSGMTAAGNVVASILAGVAKDALGNLNIASGTATATYTSQPTATVSQAATLANPSAATNLAPINFTVTFNQPVVDFNSTNAAKQLSFAGSTAPGTLVGRITGSGTAYTVSVSGMTGTGRVQLSIVANTVHNAANQANAASKGTANYLFYDITPPSELLVSPTAGAAELDATINNQHFLEVAYSAQVGVGVNTPTITTKGPQFKLSGPGVGTAVITSNGISLGGDLFEYKFSGSFVPGAVTMSFIAGSFQDNAGNYDKAATYSFNVFRGISIAAPAPVIIPAKGTVNAVFTVSLTGANTAAAVSVRYTTVNGTAVAGKDYTAVSGTVTIPAGKTTATISVPVLANSTTTSAKTFQLNLSSPSNAILIPQQSSATCTIERTSASTLKPALMTLPAVTVGPMVPSSLAAAVASLQAAATSNQKQSAVAADAVFATLLSKQQE